MILHKKNRPYPAKDGKEARKYYETAMKVNIKYGDLPRYLWNMYRGGRGGATDGKRGLECYGKAMSFGWYGALYEEALIYDSEQKECRPIEKDERRAVQLYIAAEGAGVCSAPLMLALADCYRRGRWVKKNETKAKDVEAWANGSEVWAGEGDEHE